MEKSNDTMNYFLQDNTDELEGIIQNEPRKNKYETVKYHKMNQFPYFLVGKVVSKFEIDGVNKYLNGVGILVGPSIVLTVAHNLCHITQNGQILQTKKVMFYPSANGDYMLYDFVKSIRTYVPEGYISALKSENRDEQLNNDWGLIYLSQSIGDSITSLLDIEKRPELKVENNSHLYAFFTNLQSLKLDNLINQTQSEKIAIVGYTEFREKYKNNSAYKFYNNFTKNTKVTEKEEKQTELKIMQKNQYFNEIVGESENDKNKIKMNDDVPEGLITNSRYCLQKINSSDSKTSVNGLDYIILGEEDKNKEFNVNDAEKQIMSESKGKLIPPKENEMRAIKYKISTYKGQSGSPIFLRYKRISSSKKGDYVYQFIGLHSKRGPSIGQTFNESAPTENLVCSELPNFPMIRDITKEVLSKDNLTKENSGTSITIKECDAKTQTKKQNEILLLNGVCDFNMAVSLVGDISSSVINQATLLQDIPQEIDEKNKSDFIYTKLLINDKVKFEGLFKKNVPISVLFSFASQIFSVPKVYLLLKDIGNFLGYSILNFNYDQDKKIGEIMEDPENCNSLSFEVILNIKKYGEVLAKNILEKFLETNDIEEKNMKKDIKKYLKGLFHLIFKEINQFESIPLTYGKLFKKIRKMIFTRLELNDQAKN